MLLRPGNAPYRNDIGKHSVENGQSKVLYGYAYTLSRNGRSSLCIGPCGRKSFENQYTTFGKHTGTCKSK